MFKQAQPRMALINHYESGGPALDAELVAKSAMVSIRHSRPLMPRQGSVKARFWPNGVARHGHSNWSYSRWRSTFFSAGFFGVRLVL
jgi:hypothetical protein